MKLRKVKPSEIVIPEVRVTARFDDETYRQFQESIKATGNIAPIICFEVEDKVVLCDGLHRLQETIANGEPLIDVVIAPGDMVDVYTKNIFLDHLRGKTPVSDMVKVIKTLYQDYGLDPDKIKEKTGLTRSYIEKLIKIGTASSAVQEAIDQGIIGVGHAYELARLPYAVQQEEILAKHQVWRFNVKELAEQIDNVLREMDALKATSAVQTPGVPRPPPVYHCEGCKEVVEPRYLRPVMVCPDCFGELWRLGKSRKPVEAKIETSSGGD